MADDAFLQTLLAQYDRIEKRLERIDVRLVEIAEDSHDTELREQREIDALSAAVKIQREWIDKVESFVRWVVRSILVGAASIACTMSAEFYHQVQADQTFIHPQPIIQKDTRTQP